MYGVPLFAAMSAEPFQAVHPGVGLPARARVALVDGLPAGGVRRLPPARELRGRRRPQHRAGRAADAHLVRCQRSARAGNHGSIPSTITDATLAQFDRDCEIANILGFSHIGTGSDPTSSSFLADWQTAAERWNVLGERAKRHGLKLYTHNHSPAYSFLLDSGPNDDLGRLTRSSGLRRLEWFLQNTDPKHVYLEMDIYWALVAQYQHRSYAAADGTTVESIFDPAALVAANAQRYPLFHAKDGKFVGGSGGYSFVPFGTGDIDYATFYRRIGAKGAHHSMNEQDNAGSYPTASPDASLRNASISYGGMASLRG